MNATVLRPVRFCAASFAALLVALAAPAAAVSVPVDWSNAFRFSAPGVENPLLQVGFNPQPEPPGGGVLSFGTPPNPAYPPDPIITHSGATIGTPFRLLFGMNAASNLIIVDADFENPGLFVIVLADAAPISDAPRLFEVQLELGTSGGGVPIDWVAFNPQPEPPAIGVEPVSFAADFTFDAFSDATLAIRLHDASGMPLALTQVPEPATLALLAAGLVAAAPRLARRRRAV